jgi:hypothetical protein
LIGGLAALALLPTTLLGAAAAPTQNTTVSSSPSSSPAPTPQPTGCTPATIAESAAITDPAQRPIVGDKYRPSRDNGEKVLLQALGDGEVLIEIGGNDDAEHLRPGRLVLEDLATGERAVVRGPADLHQDTQTYLASVSETHVVWQEDPGRELANGVWTMYAYDRATKKISTVAKAHEVDPYGGAPTVGWTRPAIGDNGWVYWAEGRNNPVEGKTWVTNIYGRELGSTRRAQLIVKNAYQATTTGGWLYYQDWDRVNKEPGYAIHRRSLTDGRTELVHRDPKRGGGAFLAANGDVAAWTTGNDELLVYRGSTRIARVTPKKDSSTAWVTAGPDMIGFTTGEGAATNDMLLDLRDGWPRRRAWPGSNWPAARSPGRCRTRRPVRPPGTSAG